MENNCRNGEIDEETSECFHDTVMNVVAETLVRDIIEAADQSHEDDLDREESFYDVTTGLENCKITDNDNKNDDHGEANKGRETQFLDGNSSPHFVDESTPRSSTCDSSLTDDDIEVICKYSSPNVDSDLRDPSDIDSADDGVITIDNIENNANQIPEDRDTTLSQIIYLPPENYLPQDIPPPPIPTQTFINSGLVYQQPSQEHIYPSHVVDSQMFLQQNNPHEQHGDQIENGVYPSYTPASGDVPEYPSYSEGPNPNKYQPPFETAQYPMPWVGDSMGGDYSVESSSGFVFPSIYVSTSGLITVFLKDDTSVEMTIDRTVRIVCHNRMMAVASSSRGNVSVLFHPTVKLYQDGRVTEVQVNSVKTKLLTEEISFANDISAFRFDANMIEPATPNFRDMSKDESVNLLFSSESYGEEMTQRCLIVSSQAEYELLPNGGIQIRINGVKITQNARGDVVVVTGPKYLKIAPNIGTVRINTQYIELSVEKDQSTRVRRGPHILKADNGRVMLSNGRIEAGFDSQSRLKVWSLPGRSPLKVGVQRQQKFNRLPRRRANAFGGGY